MKTVTSLGICLALLALLNDQVQGFRTGAPDNPEICRSMMPNHGVYASPQKDPPPFDIILSRESYRAGDNIQVLIRSTGFTRFRGFFVQARRADPTLNQNDPIGYFAQLSGSHTICASRYGNGLTHRSGSPGSDELKSELTMAWSAPTPSQGHLQFRVTIVVDKETYWVAELSKVVMDPTAPPLPEESLPHWHVDMPVAPIDTSGCGSTKGCYRNPPGCTEIECHMMVTWVENVDGNYVDFELSADTGGWVAVGFSHDKKMGKDDVTECVWNEEASNVEVRQSWNIEGEKTNRPQDPENIGLLSYEGYKSDGRVRCRFRREMKVTGRTNIFDLGYHYHILLARGDVTKNGHKLIHVLEPAKYPYVSPGKVYLSDNVDISGTARYPLAKLHGCLMIIAWMMCACTAVLMAKYYKPMWPNEKLCGTVVWFAVHRGCLILTLFCTIIGFILIFVHCGGYSHMPKNPPAAHPILGIVVTILCVINPLLALCRPRSKSRWRPVFNWIHWFIGTVGVVLATPTLFIGLNLDKVHAPWWTTWVLVAFMLFHLIIELLLEIHGCINSRKQKRREEEFELRKKTDHRGDLYGKKPEPVGTRFKKTLLSMYLFVVIVLGLVMVIAIASG